MSIDMVEQEDSESTPAFEETTEDSSASQSEETIEPDQTQAQESIFSKKSLAEMTPAEQAIYKKFQADYTRARQRDTQFIKGYESQLQAAQNDVALANFIRSNPDLARAVKDYVSGGALQRTATQQVKVENELENVDWSDTKSITEYFKKMARDIASQTTNEAIQNQVAPLYGQINPIVMETANKKAELELQQMDTKYQGWDKYINDIRYLIESGRYTTVEEAFKAVAFDDYVNQTSKQTKEETLKSLQAKKKASVLTGEKSSQFIGSAGIKNARDAVRAALDELREE